MVEKCPTSWSLQEYLAGRLDDESSLSLESHLRACAGCQRSAADLIGEDESWLTALRRMDSNDALMREPELASVLLHVRNMQPMQETDFAQAGESDGELPHFIRDYQLLEVLGEGGMGTVYRALHRRLEKVVAIKLLRPDRRSSPDAVSRFEQEMRAVGKLDHDNIVRALDAGEDAGVHFLVMDYIIGTDLGKLAHGLGPLAIADACELVRQAAMGLQYAHSSNLIHRDVKPSNLMLAQDATLKVLDLGLAHYLQSPIDRQPLTKDGQLVGTHRYMAPEQLTRRGPIDARSDVYSLGVTLYELLTGNIPTQEPYFDAELPELAHLRPGIPDDIRKLLGKMLELSPRDRLSSMARAAEVLEPHAAASDLESLVKRFSGQSGSNRRTDSNPEPPPVVANSTEARAVTTLEVHQPAGAKTVSESEELTWWRSPMFLGMCGTFVVIAGLAIGFRGFPDAASKSDKLAAVVPATTPTGSLSVEAVQAGLAPWVNLQLQQGDIQARNEDTGELVTLQPGPNSVPPGRYALSTVDTRTRLIPSRVHLGETSDVVVTAGVEFDYPVMYPLLPTEPCLVTYSGNLSLAGMADFPYRVTIRRLDTVRLNNADHCWLQVQVHTHPKNGSYNEAYLERGCSSSTRSAIETNGLWMLRKAGWWPHAARLMNSFLQVFPTSTSWRSLTRVGMCLPNSLSRSLSICRCRGSPSPMLLCCYLALTSQRHPNQWPNFARFWLQKVHGM